MAKANKDKGATVVGDTIVVNDINKFTDHLESMTGDKHSTVNITRATIKDDLFLEAEWSEELPGHSRNDMKQTCTVPIHDDLRAAMVNLHTHLAVLCDEVKTPKKGEIDNIEFEGFYVKGFQVSGSEDSEAVIINGHKDGKFGTVNLKTPRTRLISQDYPFTSELGLAITVIKHEVMEYLFNGKKAPDKQIEMDFNEGSEPGNEDAVFEE